MRLRWITDFRLRAFRILRCAFTVRRCDVASRLFAAMPAHEIEVCARRGDLLQALRRLHPLRRSRDFTVGLFPSRLGQIPLELGKALTDVAGRFAEFEIVPHLRFPEVAENFLEMVELLCVHDTLSVRLFAG